MSTMRTFDRLENKHDAYMGEDCMSKFCKSLREHTVKVFNFEKKKKKKEKKMMPLTNEEHESYLNQITCHFYKNKSLNINTLKTKIITKLKTIVIIQVNTEVLHIAYVT